MPLISVITPVSRGIDHLSHLVRDFHNQTFKNFEHNIIYDGKPSQNIFDFMKLHEKDYNVKFTWIKKDIGDMNTSPGTNPRNYGIAASTGKFCCFCDDDDRYSDHYLETFASNISDNSIVVVQMSCQTSRIYKDGSPDRTILVPEIGLPTFPIICHVGTPCFCLPTFYARTEPWRHEPEHDFRFIKRICDKFHPEIRIIGGMMIDVDSKVIGTLRDWVSIPPFYRE